MNQTNTRLEQLLKHPFRISAIVTALTFGGLTTTVQAAETAAESDEEIEQIIVTGTRRNDRTVSDSTVPVDVIDIDAMSSTGQLETSQILANITPSFNFPHPSMTDGTDHARPAVLRGLAPDHTLVLINGKRRHAGALLNINGSVGRGSGAVDMNMIPAAAIKRIEILRDGAASQYGSDAIAGVINIVLKDADEGGSLTTTYGQYVTEMAGVDQLDSVEFDENNNLIFNTSGDRTRRDGETVNISGDIGFAIGEDGFIHLAYEHSNRNATNRSGFDETRQYAENDNPKELSIDRYHYRFGKPDVEDNNFFYNAGYTLSEELSLYSFGSFSDRKGESGAFFRRPNDSRKNVPSIYPDGFLPVITSDVQDHSYTIGLKGTSGEWDWDTSFGVGKNQFQFGVKNSLNASLGAQSPTSFDAGKLAYRQSVFNAGASRFIDVSFLPNSLFVALGTEFRDESYQVIPGEEASYQLYNPQNQKPSGSQGFTGLNASTAVDSGRHNYAFFIELDTDLTDAWNVVTAARYENYSDFGSKTTGKVASRYAFTDDFAIRGALSTGFRAPSLAQTTFSNVSTIFNDGEIIETGLFSVSHPAAQALGAKELEAETSVNATIGLTWQATDNLNATLDFYQIKIDDRIVLSEQLKGPEVKAALEKAGVHNASAVRYFTNAIDTETKGFDFVVTYNMDLENWGGLALSAGYNRNKTEVTHVKANPSVLNNFGDDFSYTVFSQREITRFEEGTPKDKINLSSVWDWNDLQITLRTVRYGEVVDANGNPELNERLDPKWITDLDVAYHLTDNFVASIGANNLFDIYPRDTNSYVEGLPGDLSQKGDKASNQFMPYSGFSAYGTDGRFVYAKLRYQF